MDAKLALTSGMLAEAIGSGAGDVLGALGGLLRFGDVSREDPALQSHWFQENVVAGGPNLNPPHSPGCDPMEASRVIATLQIHEKTVDLC